MIKTIINFYKRATQLEKDLLSDTTSIDVLFIKDIA